MRYVLFVKSAEQISTRNRLSELCHGFESEVDVLTPSKKTAEIVNFCVNKKVEVLIDATRDDVFNKMLCSDASAKHLRVEKASGLRAIANRLKPLLEVQEIIQTLRGKLRQCSFENNLDAWVDQWKQLGQWEIGLEVLRAVVFETTAETASRMILTSAEISGLSVSNDEQILYSNAGRSSFDSKSPILRLISKMNLGRVLAGNFKDSSGLVCLVVCDDAAWTGKNAINDIESIASFVKENQGKVKSLVFRFSHASLNAQNAILEAFSSRLNLLEPLTPQLSVAQNDCLSVLEGPAPNMLIARSKEFRQNPEKYRILEAIATQLAPDEHHIWGFGNCGGTLLFQHSIPDNLAPILTARKDIRVELEGRFVDSWVPLVFWR